MDQKIKALIGIGLWLCACSALPGGQEGNENNSYTGQWKRAQFKLDGLIFAGYEFLDQKENGVPDLAGPVAQNAGFKISRTYLNLRGKIVDGPYTGWGFRVTTDIVPFALEGDGCGASCSGSNDYTVILKYAFISFPVKIVPFTLGRSYLRFGQQHNPTVNGRAGFSMQNYWAHRHIERTSWQDFGFSGASTDRGISFIHQHDYFGLHLLLANGEGFQRNNAENISNMDLEDLSRGRGDSFGLDTYGMLSFAPGGRRSGKGRGDFTEFVLHFPFRVRNVIGANRSETRVATADVTGTMPTFTYFRGDARTKRDLAYGMEADLALRRGDFSFTIGAGAAVLIDRRNNAFKLDADGFDFHDPAVLATEIETAVDSRARARYIFAHFRLGAFGAFFRHTRGTSAGSLTRQAAAPDNRNWLMQAMILDAADGVPGDLNYTEARRGIDLGRGRLRNTLFGITWHPTENSSISLGISLLRVLDGNGELLRNNELQRVQGEGTTTLNLADQLESNPDLKGRLGYHGEENPNLNDFIGKTDEDRQVFLRASFGF